MTGVPHVAGVKDEYVDAAFVVGAIYLLWKLTHRAVTPSTLPPVSGPPATVLPPPPGGHTDPVTTPDPARGGFGSSLVYHVPPPHSQRDYYGSGTSIAPAQMADNLAVVQPGVFMVGPWKGVTPAERNAQLHATAYDPPAAPGTIQAGKQAGVRIQGPSPAAHPKRIGGHAPVTPRNSQRSAQTKENADGTRTGRSGMQY